MVIECGGKKVEWWRVHEKGLPNWSSCCPLLWFFVTSLVPDFLSLGHGVTKPKVKNSQKITVLRKLENFYGALFSGKQRISWAKILIGSLSTWLFWDTHNRELAVFLFNLPLQHHIYIFECILIIIITLLTFQLWLFKVLFSLVETISLKIWERPLSLSPLSWHAKCSLQISVRGSESKPPSLLSVDP